LFFYIFAISVLGHENKLKIKKHDKEVHYAGFGWKKQGEYTSKESWEKYLGQFANNINHPLRVKIN